MELYVGIFADLNGGNSSSIWFASNDKEHWGIVCYKMRLLVLLSAAGSVRGPLGWLPAHSAEVVVSPTVVADLSVRRTHSGLVSGATISTTLCRSVGRLLALALASALDKDCVDWG